MTRNENATETKEAAEMGHDSKDVITIDTIKSFFQGVSQQQEMVLNKAVNPASLVTN